MRGGVEYNYLHLVYAKRLCYRDSGGHEKNVNLLFLLNHVLHSSIHSFRCFEDEGWLLKFCDSMKKGVL